MVSAAGDPVMRPQVTAWGKEGQVKDMLCGPCMAHGSGD